MHGLSDAQIDTPYRDGGWTVRQVVHHVADSHLNAYIRFKLGLTEDAPPIKPYDEALWADLPDVAEVVVGDCPVTNGWNAPPQQSPTTTRRAASRAAELALLAALVGPTVKLRWKLSMQVRGNGAIRTLAATGRPVNRLPIRPQAAVVTANAGALTFRLEVTGRLDHHGRDDVERELRPVRRGLVPGRDRRERHAPLERDGVLGGKQLQRRLEVRQGFVPRTRPLRFPSRLDQGLQHVMLLGARLSARKYSGA